MMRSALRLALVVCALCLDEGLARAQACCVGASGLTPGWLANHERWLVGAQLRVSETHGTYPTSGDFYGNLPGRDTRIEPSLFGTVRFLPRAQLSVVAPLVTIRRRSGRIVETRTKPGDVSIIGRYDILRPGESQIPGIAILAGGVVPTGTPLEKGTGSLSADVTGLGAWEADLGVSIEQTYGGLILHGTALFGVRAPRTVIDKTQTLGPRALYLLGAGWAFNNDVTLFGTVTHTSEGDATVGGEEANGSGFRLTQLAFLVVTPLSDTMRLRTSVFTDVPPLGNNRTAMGGTSIALLKSWY
jgi:hypothetical protein